MADLLTNENYEDEDLMKHQEILIIDDDESIRETLKFALESVGYQVFDAGNGREAIDLLARIPRPQLILLDMMMPVMDGREFATLMANEPKLMNIPIVLLTAAVDRAKTIEHAAGILKKPLDLNSLLETVQRYCGSENGSTPNPRKYETPAAQLD
ncbi:MAG: response regulator [Bdellovibrionales bacterium]